MSVNRHLPHVLVLPEDDANGDIARGFQLSLHPLVTRQMQVLQVAGGWLKVLDRFESDHVADMNRNANRFIILLIDLDGKKERPKDALQRVPNHLKDRVFSSAS